MNNDINELYLLKLIDIHRLLDVHLEEVEESPDDVQHRGRDASGGKDFAYNAISVLKLERCLELS